MTGFAVSGTPVDYDVPTSLASLGLGILMIGIGIFIVGSRRTAPMALVTGGTVTGLGIATIHFLSMAGVRLHGRVEYDTPTVALSVLIAVAAATAALWTVVAHQGFLWDLTASAVMGVAATGMHYTGMAAVHVRLDPGAVTASGGGQDAPTLLPMLIGPAVLLLFTAVMVLFDPLMESGPGNGEPPEALFSGPAGVPAQRTRRGAQPRLPHRAPAEADRASARSEHGGAPDFHDW
jgi:NO-binding membrane sensor protein with MHYT domain